MPPLFHLADLHAQASLPRVAHSALPDAPVRPHVEPHRRIENVIAALRRPLRRPILRASAVGRPAEGFAP